ncbi:isoprenoid synthase domain-containing protein [Vararia minispora EC-137]|uniref:Isoprenoid synthase domain-containing protein n=1 Tax=Vararia minispora EC-137 TaxID=1314806 RepID=A0ACB8QUV7_9AGAM|nr:isoprenoid synthase domain-containing protein [Vararia minispora EC-137]
MLVLSTLHKLLSQALSSDLPTAALLTPSGQLVACAYSHDRTKDDVRVVVGLAGEVWAEVRDVAAAESELGRIVVVPVQDTVPANGTTAPPRGEGEAEQPLMLVVLCATDAIEWDDLEAKSYSILATNRHALDATSQRPLRSDTVLTTPPPRPDPYKLLKPQLDTLRERLLNLLGSAHPTLTEIAKYYFLHPSKQVRPLLVLLFARATNGLGADWDLKHWAAECEGARGRTEELDQPLSRPDVLNDWNPYMPDHTASFSTVFSLLPLSPPPPSPRPHPRATPEYPPTLTDALLPTQARLAQIVEMIHVASLLHDDVVDNSNLRRGAPSAPAAFGNKFTILAGDFLLGRASAALSRLGDAEVVELIASVITNLVEGEILQLNKVVAESAALAGGHASSGGREGWNMYLKKTYLKTASLMAKGARASVVLGGAKTGELWKEVAYAYGRNIGIAFQLVDDVLDYEAGEATLGKPGGADLQLGLATGPALYAWEEHPEMGPLIARKFAKEGDVELARDLVRRSSGVQRTRELAIAHADKAMETLQHLPDSDAKGALEVLTRRVVKRTW